VYAIRAELASINAKLGVLLTAQDDINAAQAAITALLTDIQAQVATLATDLTAIQAELAAGGQVSTTALDSAVGQIGAVEAALDQGVAAVTTAATPPATPPPPTA
jgi:hypothetical protein